MIAVGPDECAEIEIVVTRAPAADAPAPALLSVTMRVARPGSDADDGASATGLGLDRAQLTAHGLDAAAYGRVLTELLFAAGDLRAAFARARVAAPRLRVRLSVGPGSSDLHALRWETLRDPDRVEAPLLTDRRILFSRHLASRDWRPVRLRPREALRVLVVVAGPAGLEAYGLAAIDVAAELARVRDNVGGLDVTALCSAPGQPVTRERLQAALQAGPDVLYMVCHGRVERGGQGAVLLEDADGRPAWVRGAELVQGIVDLEQRPRLCVLASCEGAGTGRDPSAADGGPLVALGPGLVEAGVPAVLAMQGLVRMRTVAEFMPVFFRELAVDGWVDRAVASARAVVVDPQEAWRPVLFMRLRRGRLWYDPGFGAGGLGNWEAVRQKIEDGECTPIFGPGLLETMFEYRGWLARRWAREFAFPLASPQHEELTAVAQYLASKQGPDFPHKRLVKDLQLGLGERVGAGSIVEQLGALRRRRFAGRVDPYAVLAALPLPLFLLASPDPLVAEALRERGKRPVVAALPWRRGLRHALTDAASVQPSVEAPLVYHLFGALAAPRSLVLTQDDYVDLLLRIHKPEVRDMIPPVVLERLVDSSLLFLGFQVDSWEFRAVFRTVMQQEGMESSLGPHIAAQLDPDEGQVLDAGGARAYFERYLQGAHVDVYWGTADSFLVDLERQRRRG